MAMNKKNQRSAWSDNRTWSATCCKNIAHICMQTWKWWLPIYYGIVFLLAWCHCISVFRTWKNTKRKKKSNTIQQPLPAAQAGAPQQTHSSAPRVRFKRKKVRKIIEMLQVWIYFNIQV
jgi:MFS superfamily sulfate permease-like transporter